MDWRVGWTGVFKNRSAQTVSDIVPTPWEAAAFWHCCMFCSREPHCLWCFYRRVIPARCDPSSAPLEALFAHSSDKSLSPVGVSTTGNPAAPWLCCAPVLDRPDSDRRQTALWSFCVSQIVK